MPYQSFFTGAFGTVVGALIVTSFTYHFQRRQLQAQKKSHDEFMAQCKATVSALDRIIEFGALSIHAQSRFALWQHNERIAAALQDPKAREERKNAALFRYNEAMATVDAITAPLKEKGLLPKS